MECVSCVAAGGVGSGERAGGRRVSDLSRPALSADAPEATHVLRHHAMACDWEIWFVGESAAYAEQAAAAAFEEVDRLERDLSRFREDSDVSRINALRPGEWTRIGPDAFACLTIAAQVFLETCGAFDPTVGGRVPARGQVAADATRPVGMQHLRVDPASRSVSVAVEGLVLDFGAIGKGYAVDQAASTLREWRIESALVQSGQSSLYAIGAPPGKSAWEIAVRNPLNHAASLGVVALRDESLSGSGVRIHGAHIIDPRGGGSATGVTAAWARDASAARSDAISTAYMVLSDEEAEDHARRMPAVAALRAKMINDRLELREFGAWGWLRNEGSD
jgi:thiamine biosynthesis lipoprotein